VPSLTTVTIRTPRLELAPLRVADADEMVGVLADPALYTVIGGEPPTLAELRDRYVHQVVGRSPDGHDIWANWIVRERWAGRTVIGFVQATIAEDGRTAEVAWLIGVPWQGRGYASEAAAGLVTRLGREGIRTIVAHIHPDHLASAGVARAAGLAPTEAFVEGERVWRWRARSPA
jgi:RimJ/RimL family protein N-acetyltransferase